jgi:hypothetical protein
VAMTEPRDAAIAFEAVRAAIRQTKDGWSLTLVIHPNDMNKELAAHPIGTRYQVALVEVNDEGEPVIPPGRTEGQRRVQSAGMLARNPQFQVWVVEQRLAEEVSEAHAADAICRVAGIESRAELATNEEAGKLFDEMRLEFSKTIP